MRESRVRVEKEGHGKLLKREIFDEGRREEKEEREKGNSLMRDCVG